MGSMRSPSNTQVWKGALLLCDAIVALGSALEGIVAVELGAGTGQSAD